MDARSWRALTRAQNEMAKLMRSKIDHNTSGKPGVTTLHAVKTLDETGMAINSKSCPHLSHRSND